VRIVTLNVCYGVRTRLAPAAVRAAEFCRRIEALDVDVVNLQEVWTPRLLARIRTGLPSLPHVAWRRGIGGQPAGGLATLSRVPVTDVRYRTFRRARVGAGAPMFRLRHRVEAAFHGVLLVTIAGEPPVLVGNVHLTANRDGDWSAGNRHHRFQAAQLGLLRDAMRGPEPAVLTGDFNVTSGSPLYPSIVDGWRDPFAATDPATYQESMLPSGRRASRIDYILVRGVGDPVETALLFAKPCLMALAPLARAPGPLWRRLPSSLRSLRSLRSSVQATPAPAPASFGLVSDHVGLLAGIAGIAIR
jgi:endonuclease/exonuclease/phosphatase family metal-dependent hydrolase